MVSTKKFFHHRLIACAGLCALSAAMAVTIPIFSARAGLQIELESENTPEPSQYVIEQQEEIVGTLVRVRPPYPVYIDDPNIFEDESYIVRTAESGVTAVELLRDGTIISETELLPSQAQIIAEGTKRRISTGDYIVPAVGKLSSGFGRRQSSGIASTNHKGIDIANKTGTPIVASDGGTVVFAGSGTPYNGYGQLVVIEHENGDLTFYGHLSKILVEEGNIVYRGDEIGKMGNTGNSTGPHLHFEYRPGGGEAVDPLTIITLD